MGARPRRIFALTGAGISAESGLGTFRDTDGLWTRFGPMKLATPEAFARDPAAVQAFYNARRANLLASQPNPAHEALARLATGLPARGGELILVTQNIDDLHERAGSPNVIHMHGELRKARCLECGAVNPWAGDLGVGEHCPGCQRRDTLRPHVVWFGEVPLRMEEIFAALTTADLFVAIGTSGSVYPAAGFVTEAADLGLQTCELNLEPSDNAHVFDERRYGVASAVVPAWVSSILDQADAAR